MFYREKVLEMFRHAYNSYMVSIYFEYKHPLLKAVPEQQKAVTHTVKFCDEF